MSDPVPRDRATSRSCLDVMKQKPAAIMGKARTMDVDDLELGWPSDPREGKRQELGDAARLTREFLRDPDSVLRARSYAMTVSSNFEQKDFTSVPQLPTGPDYYLVTQKNNATVRFYAEHPRYPGARELQVTAAEKEDGPKVYLLPWQDSKLTYCKLAEDAALVLTGPLNGCSVFVVEVDDAGNCKRRSGTPDPCRGRRTAEERRRTGSRLPVAIRSRPLGVRER